MKAAKYLSSIILCNLFRLLRFIPNNDPIMGFLLPFARRDGAVKAGAFAFLTMASFDILTGMFGVWTLVTSVTYGLLGYAFGKLYEKRKLFNLQTYLASGIGGVLVFDFITGPVASSLMFNMPFSVALAGQIPFTILHLLTVSAFVALFTPLIDRAIVANPALEDDKLASLFKA